MLQAHYKLIACSWVPILQGGGLGKVRVNCFPKAITTWLGRESNPRPPDPESDALTTLRRCPLPLLCPLTIHFHIFLSSLLFYYIQQMLKIFLVICYLVSSAFLRLFITFPPSFSPGTLYYFVLKRPVEHRFPTIR